MRMYLAEFLPTLSGVLILMRFSDHKKKIPFLPNRLMLAGLFLVAITSPARSQQGWMPTRVGPPGQDLNTVFFLDSKRGWVGGDKGFLSSTNDGGHSWVQQNVDTTNA